MTARRLPQVDACHPEGGCITCGDTAVAMRVERVDAARALATCSDETGAREDVAIELVEPIEPGEALLVHAGVALARLEPEQVAS